MAKGLSRQRKNDLFATPLLLVGREARFGLGRLTEPRYLFIDIVSSCFVRAFLPASLLPIYLLLPVVDLDGLLMETSI
ncbi:hypothetical protein BT69DRAFT_1286160 [Atractiella rhizophila]|nr:hypothetical protein BT69DRAFT_1286160 [Atractiella rhizophila]